ncbi:hypothetical protein ACFL9T_14220 [Thermodesulfobacteriota bacterium]
MSFITALAANIGYFLDIIKILINMDIIYCHNGKKIKLIIENSQRLFPAACWSEADLCALGVNPALS